MVHRTLATADAKSRAAGNLRRMFYIQGPTLLMPPPTVISRRRGREAIGGGLQCLRTFSIDQRRNVHDQRGIL